MTKNEIQILTLKPSVRNIIKLEDNIYKDESFSDDSLSYMIGGFNTLCFHKDKDLLITKSEDFIQFWNLTTYQCETIIKINYIPAKIHFLFPRTYKNLLF